MSAIRMSILLDNNTLIDQYYIGEPGFSVFLEADGKKILFDTGYSDAYLKNAHKLGIDPLEAETIVLSHGHLDHTWGLMPLMRAMTEREFHRAADESVLEKPILLGHPACFMEKSSKVLRQLGNVFSLESLQALFDVRMMKTPVQLSEHVLYLGEIPRETPFEPAYAIGNTADGPDYLKDDTALAITTVAGLVILTGCSHAGICNIVKYAQELTGESRICDIVGGFHLLNPSDERLNGTVEFLKKVNPTVLHACHCTDLRSKITMGNRLPLHEVGSGLVLEY
jgi:7,8-dihydropterin-6-yl-methyl-4-(beta-D-ribofuranosyl)aminobenzene 5'-phosphate synthase